VWWCPCYVTVVYVNCWSWHVHGSHSVYLLKPGVTGSMGVPPANGIDRHAACQRNGQVSLNAEVAHCLPVEWTGRRLTAEWVGLIKCRGGTSLVKRRALSAINAGVTQPGGLTSGFARWLTSRAVGHVAASGPRLGGEQRRMRTGPHQTGSWHVTVPDPHLGPWDPTVGGPDPLGRSGPYPRGPTCTRGGPGPTLGVRTVYPGVRDQLWGSGLYIRGSGAHPWGSGPLLMPWSIPPSLDTWRLRTLPRGGVGRCCGPRIAAWDWGEPWLGPTQSTSFSWLRDSHVGSSSLYSSSGYPSFRVPTGGYCRPISVPQIKSIPAKKSIPVVVIRYKIMSIHVPVQVMGTRGLPVPDIFMIRHIKF
jgi:hypothetical protein